MKSKGLNISPMGKKKTPTTPIRTTRTRSTKPQEISLKSTSYLHLDKAHKRKPSEVEVTTLTTNANTNIKDNYQQAPSLEDILKRLSQDQEKENSTLCLYKKTQISKLRDLIQHAKTYTKNPEEGLLYGENNKFQNIKIELQESIHKLFWELKSELQRKQQELLDKLEEYIFRLKQNTINKCYQKSSLNRGIIQCEKEIDRYYGKIIEDLKIEDFQKVIKAYNQRFSFYIEKLESEPKITLSHPQISNVIEPFKSIELKFTQSPQKNQYHNPVRRKVEKTRSKSNFQPEMNFS